MYNQLFQPKEEILNAAIYIDYENIYELLKVYKVDPLEINFFPVILDKLKHIYQLNVMECIAYCNFEKKPLQARHQSLLQNLGIQTRHSANNGKNSSDLMLTVDTLTTLYKNPNIKVFVIISSDRDIIPLLKAVKFENKHTHVISTRYGFCPVVSCYADRHEYIEDIFNLTPDMRAAETEEELNFDIENNLSNIEQAREISILFYNSNVWKATQEKNDPVTLKGYINIVAKKIGRNASQIKRDLELSHNMKYIKIYNDPKKGICIKKGENYAEL